MKEMNLSNIFDQFSGNSTTETSKKEDGEKENKPKQKEEKQHVEESKKGKDHTTSPKGNSNQKVKIKENKAEGNNTKENDTVEAVKTVETVNEVETTPDSFGSDILKKFKEKNKKQTVEETHTRNTIFIRNDLHERLQALTSHKRGLKTLLINEALEAALDIITNENNKKGKD